ncbi:hypothetical protein BJV74DRAFT_41381 [Russula compacta]|nr:hypothetical protein BJV74DRAFT_41381 [Russula compacta]
MPAEPNGSVLSADALVKLWHAVDGVYLWEFFTTLDYEWEVIRGRRPYRWTIWVYSFTRWTGLVAVILNLVGMDVTTQIDCQAWISSALSTSYLSISAASFLIVLRVIAIWNRHKLVMAIAISLWCANIVLLIQGSTRLRSEWSPMLLTCVPVNTESNVTSLVAMVVTDIALLLTMLIGLLRVRRHGGGMFALTRLLWRQGLIWLLIATVAEVPPVVCIGLNLNDQLNVTFQTPALLTMIVAATRMHRSLSNFATGSPNITVENLPKSGFTAAKIKQMHTMPIPLNRMEVSVHTAFDQHLAPQMSDHDSSIGTEGQVHEKPNGITPDDDVEHGM